MNPYKELIAKYYKMLDVIEEDSEHGMVCPELDCYSCPLYDDSHTNGICLYSLQLKIERTIKLLEEQCI